MLRKHPCGKDCPNRKAYCRTSCHDWQAYVKERDALYADPKRKAESDYSCHVVDVIERCRKRVNRRNKRFG